MKTKQISIRWPLGKNEFIPYILQFLFSVIRQKLRRAFANRPQWPEDMPEDTRTEERRPHRCHTVKNEESLYSKGLDLLYSITARFNAICQVRSENVRRDCICVQKYVCVCVCLFQTIQFCMGCLWCYEGPDTTGSPNHFSTSVLIQLGDLMEL